MQGSVASTYFIMTTTFFKVKLIFAYLLLLVGTYVTQEVEGKETVIQAGGSDVSLQVPDGVYGEVSVRTFTNPSKFIIS